MMSSEDAACHGRYICRRHVGCRERGGQGIHCRGCLLHSCQPWQHCCLPVHGTNCRHVRHIWPAAGHSSSRAVLLGPQRTQAWQHRQGSRLLCNTAWQRRPHVPRSPMQSPGILFRGMPSRDLTAVTGRLRMCKPVLRWPQPKLCRVWQAQVGPRCGGQATGRRWLWRLPSLLAPQWLLCNVGTRSRAGRSAAAWAAQAAPLVEEDARRMVSCIRPALKRRGRRLVRWLRQGCNCIHPFETRKWVALQWRLNTQQWSWRCAGWRRTEVRLHRPLRCLLRLPLQLLLPCPDLVQCLG
mmetsp:Transcript_102422/g.330394  ORF Transcript_102422/g.330394 Transcript_102422/m.330394 type:complete len:296 (-) Transcript_102422:1057-1944(-)